MHTIPIQIRFNDVDQMGHINNAVIMEYFDLGKAQYFADAGVPVTPDEGDFAVVIVHFEVDFHAQIHYHDHLAVTTYVANFGNKSLRVKQQVINADTQQPLASCTTVMSGYSRQTGAAAIIPDELKQRVQRFDAEH